MEAAAAAGERGTGGDVGKRWQRAMWVNENGSSAGAVVSVKGKGARSYLSHIFVG
jgi:hypothetical protein